MKNQGEFERVPLTPKSKEFINYVKKEFPEFNEFEFVLVKVIKETKTAMASKVQPTLVESKVELKESSLAQGWALCSATGVVKVVEPAVRIVEPIITKVETMAKPLIDAVPNIIINNANNAQATTVTHNTQVAPSPRTSLGDGG